MHNVRSVEFVRSHYTDAWDRIYAQIVELIQSGQRNAISVVDAIESTWESSFDGPLAVSNPWIASADIPRNGDGVPLLRIIASCGNYVPAPTQIADPLLISTVCSYVSERTDYVVELGSGWGRNLLRVREALKHRRLGTNYVACELTENGRRCTELLSTLDPAPPLQIIPFNYYEPDLSFIGRDDNVVFFTNCSIEQVPQFNPQVFDTMMENSNDCVCVHSEPIGWQRIPEFRELASAADNKQQINELKQQRKMTLYKNDSFLLNSFVYAMDSSYNVDFLEKMEEYISKGTIKLDFILYDYFGFNPLNPTTLVVWRKPERQGV